MAHRFLHVTCAEEAPLLAALRRLRADAEVPAAFPPEVLAEAERAASAPRLPERDATGIPFFTVDPAGSMDLDQAMHLSRRGGGGFLVQYAIADVAAFVTPGGALDAEAQERVNTLYCPDVRVPLHPESLSEGAASLLPGQTVPALLWEIEIDSSGEVRSTTVGRALVRSRARLDYAGVQQAIDEGTAEENVALLRDVGMLREELERERGGISLGVPEQEVIQQDAHYDLEYRAPLPADGWNAQVSLLTGMAAAGMMLEAGFGILRTLPPARKGAVAYLHRVARALDVDWPDGLDYPELIRSLNPHRANHAALLQECTTLLRGAGYTVFDGHPPGKKDVVHSAVAAPYTHCTAPLRRLVDRYTGELCLAAAAGEEPPGWVREAMAGLPDRMAQGSRLAGRVERESLDLVEAAVMQDRIGDAFDGHVVDISEKEPARGTVQLYEPAVIGRVDAADEEALPLGRRLRVRLTAAEPGVSPVRFAPV